MRFRVPSLVGPLFHQELARLGRRGGTYALRVGVVLAMLGIIAALYPPESGRLNPRQNANFARELFLGLLGLQLAAVWFVTPLFAASVLTEDRERKTLDLLLTTTVTAWDIAGGKLLARLVYMGGVILAGVPVMALLQWYGGVAIEAVIIGYLALFLNLWGIGGLSAGIASQVRSYRAALYLSWGCLFVFGMCPLFSPYLVLRDLNGVVAAGTAQRVAMAAAFVVTNILVGVGGMVLAVLSVRPWENAAVKEVAAPRSRKSADAPRFKPKTVKRRAADVDAKRDKPPGLHADFDWRFPKGDCPGPSEAQVLLFLFVAAAGFALLLGLSLLQPTELRMEWPAYMVLGWVPAAVIVAVQAAGTVSREREADTLIMLLTVPPTRTEILWRKYLAATTRHSWVYLVTIGIAVIAFLPSGGLEWYPGFLAQGLGMVAAAGSYGLVMSVYSRSTFLAQAASVAFVMFSGAVPIWAGTFVLADGESSLPNVPWHFLGTVGCAVGGWVLAARGFNRLYGT